MLIGHFTPSFHQIYVQHLPIKLAGASLLGYAAYGYFVSHAVYLALVLRKRSRLASFILIAAPLTLLAGVFSSPSAIVEFFGFSELTQGGLVNAPGHLEAFLTGSS